MDEEKIYYPQVTQDNPIPAHGETEVSDSPTTPQGQVLAPSTTKNNPIPKKRTAVELLGSALNTRSKRILAEFQFSDSGALQIGKYENGVSGDIRISPNGVVARDMAGITTFALDATTGDAVFKGTIQAGSLLTGTLIVGDNSVIIDGDTRTIIVNDGTHDRILIGFQSNGF